MDTSTPDSSKNCSVENCTIATPPKNKGNRGRKRKRLLSESSSDMDDALPENTLEVENSLHASAVKNNLDDVSVKKILKKVVTNDHVLALVKLREEEEQKAAETENMQPKLTRAKAKELMKASPKTTSPKMSPWDLKNLAPIKHIPVKTRPEVEALITQELQDDEDDEEYEPTNDDVLSDDEHTLESCSDADSQPRTPATPRPASPRRDGPFKVPQDLTPRRKLDMDEDATIARRTRSKLSLSSIPIDHIESSFVPPDEPPMPVVDDIWTEFLQECMNPDTSKNEDDDDDPEYNVAADPDAHDEDEEGLENIMKISKKELNDLVTELFNIMPEATADDALSGKLAAGDAAQNGHIEARASGRSASWEGKREPLSDEEAPPTRARAGGGQTAPPAGEGGEGGEQAKKAPPRVVVRVKSPVIVSATDTAPAPAEADGARAPPPLRGLLAARRTQLVRLDHRAQLLPEQISILQQQIRQHVQLATGNFLQLFAHPVHWKFASTYKEYLETLTKMTTERPDSVANVCNLEPAVELVASWEDSMSADTPQNAQYIEFVQKQIERARRRAAQNSLYVGDFHERFKTVVANSPVFLYPYLLPPLPYRGDTTKRFSYLSSEDELIVLGIDQFWQYVEDNSALYRVRAGPRRGGLVAAAQLVCRHMLPWLAPKALLCHVQHARRHADRHNAIYRYFQSREVRPVEHVLLPFNPELTLYEQPEHEMPRAWTRHLARSSQRFRDYHYRRTGGQGKLSGALPAGVRVAPGAAAPLKQPLPIAFTQPVGAPPTAPAAPAAAPQDKFDILVADAAPAQPPPALYSVVHTPSGAYLVPLTIVTNAVNAGSGAPIVSTREAVAGDPPREPDCTTTAKTPAASDHCACCVRLRQICKERQTLITDFFTPRVKICPCKERRRTRYPKISNKLRLLVNNYKSKSYCAWQGLQLQLQSLKQELKEGERCNSRTKALVYDVDEVAAVTSFQLKLSIRTSIAKNKNMKGKVNTLLARFNPDRDEPAALIEAMDKALEIECVDVWKEFLGFLTMAQADRIGRFLDYFKQECLMDLMKQIEAQVSNKNHKLTILTKLRRLLTLAKISPCDFCAELLEVLQSYPRLAQHVFSLFPHSLDDKKVNNTVNQPTPAQTEQQQETVANCNGSQVDKNREEEMISNESAVAEKEVEEEACNDYLRRDYEADHSASDDEGSNDNLTIVEEPVERDATEVGINIKTEEIQSENVIDTPHLTVTKTEVQDYSESEQSMMIMWEDDVKSEPQEWKREEDKLLLEVLKESLTPEERKNKTILEIIEEKKLLNMVAENLHKSIDDIRERIIYLLQMLVNEYL